MTTLANPYTPASDALPGLAGASAALRNGSATRPADTRAQTAPASPNAGPLALALHAAVLAQPTAAAAAQALAITLARQQALDGVWVFWAHGLHLQMLGRSDGKTAPTAPRGREPDNRHEHHLQAAAAECFDQAACIAWPAPGAMPHITRAHAALARDSAAAFRICTGTGIGTGASVASLPLVVDGQRVGVLCVLRGAGAGAGQQPNAPAVAPAVAPGVINTAELQQLEHLAGLAAPLLWLMKRNERRTLQRCRDALAAAWARAHTQRKARWQLLACATAALLLLVMLLPWPAQVGGRARLEGAVQRVLAAPADGFVQQVHARAGDTVRAGQPLLDLADQDLQLERQRWHSQLAQHLDALASAQARADRAQLVLHQSKADEAQAQLALVDEKLLRSRLVAPFDATVVQGDWSQQLGAPVKEGAELLTLAPLGRYRVIVEVDERDIGGLQPTGNAATAPAHGVLTLSALPWDSLPLRVTRVSPLAKAVEGRNVFEVEAELLPAPGPAATGLRPGLQGRARLDTQPASPLLHGLRRTLGALRMAWWGWWG